MRTLVLSLVVLAACGEKMTPEQCVKTVARMAERTEQCAAPGRAAASGDLPDDFADVMREMCKHDDMKAMATSTLPCLEMSACSDYLACLKQPSLDEAVKKLLPR